MAELSQDDRRLLLALARGAIRKRLDPSADLTELESRARRAPALDRCAGMFVTLKTVTPTGPSLRGCVGCMQSEKPLGPTVAESAANAAFEDPRFSPLTLDELARLRISVSILSPLTVVHGSGDVVIGRDGVQLESAGRRAVFLPQVAREQGWDVERLLEQLALKAGLPASGWRSATLSVFQAESFAEGEAG